MITRRQPPNHCHPLLLHLWAFLLLLVLTSAFRLPSGPLSSSSSPRAATRTSPPTPTPLRPSPPLPPALNPFLLQGWRPILNPTSSSWPLCPQTLEEGVVEGGWLRTNRSGKKVLIRRMQRDDLGAVLDMAQSEFGSSEEGFLARLENFYLRRNVFLSFMCRLYYFGDEEDHRIFVVDDGGVVGVAEVSKQAQTGLPGPLLPVPRIFKLLLNALGFKIKPYIGNLLIDRSCRRQGYAQMLVQHCEFYAASIGYDEVYLHADADYRPACALYARLGYETLRDDPTWVERLGRIRMRYMKKKLKPPLA